MSIGDAGNALDEEDERPPRKLILRVDRTDPSKNVVRGFLAFGTLLDQHPELVGQVSFLALLQPSRTDVAEYGDYISTIGAVVAEVNARHTAGGRQPIDLQLVEDFALAVGAYSICDVIMVNALADGMNLVAKEVAVVNRRNGVLALSENTGAFEELGQYAVPLYPFDVQQMADALYEALTMPEQERARLLAGAAEQVRTHDVGAWLQAQLSTSACSTPASIPTADAPCRCAAGKLFGVVQVAVLIVTQEDMVASSEGHVSATPGAWLAVILIILAFVFGTIRPDRALHPALDRGRRRHHRRRRRRRSPRTSWSRRTELQTRFRSTAAGLVQRDVSRHFPADRAAPRGARPDGDRVASRSPRPRICRVAIEVIDEPAGSGDAFVAQALDVCRRHRIDVFIPGREMECGCAGGG